MSFTYEMHNLGYSADISLFGGETFETISEQMLNEVRPDVENEVKKAVKGSVGHPGDSELVNSTKTYDPHMTGDKTGARLHCSFAGKSKSGNYFNTVDRGKQRKKAVYNSDKAFWLEYGVAGRQAPKPWQDRAYRNVEAKVYPKLEKSFEKIVGAE